MKLNFTPNIKHLIEKHFMRNTCFISVFKRFNRIDWTHLTRKIYEHEKREIESINLFLFHYGFSFSRVIHVNCTILKLFSCVHYIIYSGIKLHALGSTNLRKLIVSRLICRRVFAHAYMSFVRWNLPKKFK